MNVRYLASAREEAFAAADYYELQAAGLGAEFFRVLDGAIDLILASPGAGAEYELQTRRLVLPRFPYTVFYEIDGDELLIVAVAHQRRRPGYWHRRQT